MTKEELELKIIRQFNCQVEAIESNYKIKKTSYSATAENVIDYLKENIIINYEKLNNAFVDINDIRPIIRNNEDELTFIADLEIDLSIENHNIIFKKSLFFN